MSWLGDAERSDPAYPGKPGDMTTSSWSRLDSEVLQEVLAEEDAAEARAAYRGRHRKPGTTGAWSAIR